MLIATFASSTGQVAKLLHKARAQTQAGKYKAAVNTLLNAELLVRGGEYGAARELLDLATKLRDQTRGWAKDECERFIENAQKLVSEQERIADRLGLQTVAFAPALYLGVYPNLSNGVDRRGAGILWFATEWIGIGTPAGDQRQGASLPMSAAASIEIPRGKRSPQLGQPFILETADDHTTEVVIHTRDNELVYFRIEQQSPQKLREAITPLLESVGVHFTEKECADRARQEALQEARAWEKPAQIGQMGATADLGGSGLTYVSAPSGEHFMLEGVGEVPAPVVVQYALRGELLWSDRAARETVGGIAAAGRLAWQAEQPASDLTDAQMEQLFFDGQKSVRDGCYAEGFRALKDAAPWALAQRADDLFDVLSSIPKDARELFEVEHETLLRWTSYWAGEKADEIDEVDSCTVLGCSDDSFKDLTGSLVFKNNGVYFAEKSERGSFLFGPRLFARYEDVTALEIGGPGKQTTGGGFIGGGFGAEGAVTGMLVATGLNLLTTRTHMKTVICVQTRNGEMFLGNKWVAPDQLRMLLAEVFTLLRQKHEAAASETQNASADGEKAAAVPATDLVSQLAKLAELHDTGKLTDEEFVAFKAKLME